jgi:4,5-dihydroxyphthalate decarboxylase
MMRAYVAVCHARRDDCFGEMTQSGESVTTPGRPWRTLLGDYPVTRALRQGRVPTSLVSLEFADVAVPNKAFKRVVRDLEFDVAELALMTFLAARSCDVPLRLLPVVLFSRNPLKYLVCRADRGRLHPRGLAGRRIGARAYTTTTAAWARALLADQFSVDLDALHWLTFEEPHVASAAEPPIVTRRAAHADLQAMLLDGTVDAAIVDPVPDDRRITTLVPQPDAAWHAWQHKTGAQTINHIVVVRESLAEDSARMRELFRLFEESRAIAGMPVGSAVGFEALVPSLEAAIAAAAAQHLLARPLTLDDLVTGTLASLA